MAKKYGRIAGRGGRDRLTALLLACAMVACSWTVSAHAERDGSSLSGAERTSAESGAEASSAVSGGSEPAAASDGESGAQSAAGSSAPEVSSGETASSEGQISSGETASSEGRASSGETASSEAHAPYELKQQKLAAAVYADEKLETKSDGKTAITVEGSLPAGAAVKAYPVRVKLGGAAVLAAYDITVYGPDGAAYQPEKPVRVSISAPKLKDAPSVDVYHVQDAPAGEDEAARAAGSASVASEPRDDDGNGAPVEQATVEQNGSEKAMKATKVAGGVKPESETVEFQAEGFSIYVVTGEGSSTAGSKVAVNDSTNPSYIKMDTETQTTVKANVRDIPTQGVHAEAITVKNATVSWTSNNTDVVAIAPSGSSNINLPSTNDFTATLTAKGNSLEEGATATATVTISFTYTLHHAGYSRWGKNYPEWDDSSTIETAQIHVTIQKPSGETGTGSGETKHEKTVVKRTGGNAATPSGDPIYDLTLDFSGTMQQFTSKQDVDIVFVVDVSGSMDDPIKSGSEKSRIEAAKEAIGTLQAAAGPGAGGKDLNARYALVCFSGNRVFLADNAYNDAVIQQGWTDSVDTTKILIANDNTTGKGTNYEAGLLLADNLIANDHSSAKKLVIFLSDGVPTYRYDTDGYTDGTGTNDNEWSHEGENLKNAVTQAQNLKSHHADYFFAVGCGELGSGQSILQSLTAVFGDTNGDNVLIATDESDLNRAFTNIINSTTTIACKNVSIVDALSDNIEIYDPSNTPVANVVTVSVWEDDTDVTSSLQDFSPNILYDSDNRVLTVSLGESYTANPAYTYKVTYPVVASESAKTAYSNDGDSAYASSTADSGTGTYAGELGFFTNKKADISDEHPAPSGGTYVTYQKVDNNNNPVGDPYYEAYPMPVIKIESLSLTLKKTDGNNNFLSGSAFTLYVKAEDAWMSVGTYQIDKDDGVAVSGLINGKSYKLEETTVPAGYLKADDIYFTVSGYQIKPTDAQGQTLAGWPKHMSFENNALTVANDKIYTLPVTGGAGNLPFRVAGAAILAGATVGLGFRLRRGKKKKGGPPAEQPLESGANSDFHRSRYKIETIEKGEFL